jgi:hypothetical protein
MTHLFFSFSQPQPWPCPPPSPRPPASRRRRSGLDRVGGEVGFVFPQHTYARVNGEWVCTDKIAHNAKPAAIKSDTERGAFLQQYPA